MSLFRITHLDFEKTFNVYKSLDTLDQDEWKNEIRLSEPGWQNRYEYEAKLVVNMIESYPIKTILEIGSGPGILSQCIQKELSYEVIYHLIDKPFAKEYFKKNKMKGVFLLKIYPLI